MEAREEADFALSRVFVRDAWLEILCATDRMVLWIEVKLDYVANVCLDDIGDEDV